MKKILLFLAAILLQQNAFAQYGSGFLINSTGINIQPNNEIVSKELIRESNGFSWYKVITRVGYAKFDGAQDINGNWLIDQCANLEFIPVDGYIGYFRCRSTAGGGTYRVYSIKGQYGADGIVYLSGDQFYARNTYSSESYATTLHIDRDGRFYNEKPSSEGTTGGYYYDDNDNDVYSSNSSSRSSSSTRSSNNTSRKYSTSEINRQADRTARAYESHKNNPTSTSGSYYRMQQNTLKRMQKNK